MRFGIRYQLLLPLCTLLLGVAGISTWTALASVAYSRRQIETQVKNVARTLGESTFPLAPSVLRQMRGLSGAEYLVIERDGRQASTLTDSPEELPSAGDWQTLQLGPPVRVGGMTYLCSGVRLQQRPGSTLYILYPEALWRDALWQAIYPSLVLGLVGGLASLALALGVAGRLGRRIRELERRTRLIAAGDFSPMPLPQRHDELRDLVGSVNEMAGRLAQLQEAVKKNERLRLLGQVSGGLAHQLRNGVTGARLAVQLHAGECLNGADPEALQVALRQLALVEANLKRFLDLGRVQEMQATTCSLPALLSEVVELLRPRCRHTRTELRWQAPPGTWNIVGDAGQLRDLFLNVLSNAVEAAGPHGWVEIRLERKGDEPAGRAWYRIAILDSGPGPAPPVAERLFEPFVTGKREGVGLGLAVAREVAEAHGGSIGWHRDAGQTCFQILLPCQSSSERGPCEPDPDRG
ncbi:MAG TPA: HAMP domain-containing sensor histidine kinase [Gemmataceae bacterium]|nr:HAMP domain-containing sensor histidine kinase [Gemmataceae bacterium]